MKANFKVLLAFMLALVTQIGIAQEKTVSGVVSDEAGLPIPGANVIIKGTTTGVQTDFDGNYTISAKAGDILSFSYLGYKTQDITVGASNTINVSMQEDAQQLEEVVLTAQGIKREKKALGYSVTEVGSDLIEQRTDGDVARVLNGKSAGVQINAQNGMSGSGTNVVIRGMSSFSSGNQALFIVDGVPFSADTNAMGDFEDGNNGSSRFLDLDPNSIEKVTVLKGLAAANLYGSQGRNGVILITTKAGASGGKLHKKAEITLMSSYFINEVASIPDYQNEYGNGFDQSFGWFFSNWGPAFRENGVDGWGNQSQINGDVSGTPGYIVHPYDRDNIRSAFPEYENALYQWKPYNSVEDFFRTGSVSNVSLNIKGSSNDGKLSYSASYGHLEDKGFTPKNKVVRNNLSMGGSAKLSNKFTVSGVLNFSLTDVVSPPVALSTGSGVSGGGSSIFGDLWYTPRSVDMMGLPYQNPITGESVYYRGDNAIPHPLWTLNNASTSQETNRVFGTTSVKYDFSDNLNLTYRVGLDLYNENNINYQNKGGATDDVRLLSGIYETWNNRNTIWDHNFSLNGDYDLNDNFGLTFVLGGTTRSEVFDQHGVTSNGQLEFDILRHYNFLKQEDIQSYLDRNIVGVYAQTEVDFRNYLFLTLAGRNDWVSNFSKDNRSILYPSASLSFIPTTAIDGIKSDAINYLKIRAGYGTSANFGDLSYPVSNNLDLDSQDSNDSAGNNVVSITTTSLLANPLLKPELLTEIELGIESKLWKNRISLDLSLYERTTKDLILRQPIPSSSGNTITNTNIGQISSIGLELDLGLDVIKNDNLNWNISTNFTAYETTVDDLGVDTDLVIFSGYSNLGNAAIEGQPFGVLYGSTIVRDNGVPVIGSDGNYITGPDGIIGDPNPDWIANIRNSLSYKNFSLGFQLNYTKGGDIYSTTISTLLGRGLIPETLNRTNTYIIPGVDESGAPNTVQINNSDFYFTNLFNNTKPEELKVFDATTIRLQEISLSYSLSDKVLEKTPFGSLTFTVSGSNLWYDAINTPDGANFDPNTNGNGVGNGMGFDFINGPSARRYGFSIKTTF